MARRKFRHSQRFESQDERSFTEYLLNQPAQLTTRTELLRLIRGGEDTYLELKVKLSNSERIAQNIVAHANTARRMAAMVPRYSTPAQGQSSAPLIRSSR